MDLIKKYSTLIALMFGVFSISAQLTENDIRKISGDGPFPIYINFSRTSSLSETNFFSLSSVFLESKTGSQRGSQRKLKGWDFHIGVKINEQGFNGYFAEIGAKLVSNRHRELNNIQSVDLRLEQFITYANFGRTFLAYPLTADLAIGLTSYKQYYARVRDSGAEYRSILYQSRRNNTNNIALISGMNALVRLNILDPGGTSGGLGINVQFHYFWDFYGLNLNDVISDLSISPSATSENYRHHMLYISAGIRLALAASIK